MILIVYDIHLQMIHKLEIQGQDNYYKTITIYNAIICSYWVQCAKIHHIYILYDPGVNNATTYNMSQTQRYNILKKKTFG